MAASTGLRRSRLRQSLAWQAAPGSGDGMTVRDVKAWPLREPESGRRYTVVRIETRNGLRGFGECAGTSKDEIEIMRRAVGDLPVSAYEIAWRRMGQAPGIRAAFNMAALDILGRQAKAPVYQVLGGPTRARCRALAMIEGPAAIERAQNAGYRAFGVKVPEPEWRNAGKAYVEKVAGLMRMMRRAAPDGDFVLDGGGLLVAGDAQSIAAELESFHLLWFDEPCGPAGLGAVKKIANENVTPLGFGRACTELAPFEDLLREECADVLRPDISRMGISMTRRVAVLGETCYVAVAPYHDGGPVATAAALQTAASIPNFVIQQIPLPAGARDQEMRKAIGGEEIERVRDGFASLPTGTGLGIQVSEAALERYKEGA